MRGPDSGYSGGTKAQWRRRVWSWMDDHLETVPRKYRRVLVIDTKEGHECEELLRRGYAASNITVVNDNPAEVALLQARFKGDSRVSGRFDTRGVTLSRAMSRLKQEGATFHAISLDYCSSLFRGLINDLHSAGGLLVEKGVIAVNVQRGRENVDEIRKNIKWASGRAKSHGSHINIFDNPDATDGTSASDFERARCVLLPISRMDNGDPNWQRDLGCRWHFSDFGMFSYRNHHSGGDGAKVTMLTVMAQVHSHDLDWDVLEIEQLMIHRKFGWSNADYIHWKKHSPDAGYCLHQAAKGINKTRELTSDQQRMVCEFMTSRSSEWEKMRHSAVHSLSLHGMFRHPEMIAGSVQRRTG